ncbi:MAG: type II toxin-antitoxin system RatA family toxin [Magnetococcales bacterium]|nr:type II toxin-antitoxin system RatA family toxin [Magnetococcales bacterium]
MPKISASATVPHSPQQMYDLVVDMDSYPKFLPWCVHATKSEETETQFLSEMTVSFKGIRQTFHTIDYLEPGRKVEIKHRSGPFKRLESVWTFSPVSGGGARVDFTIDFLFSNTLMNVTLGPLFAQASKQMVAAFRNRAQAIYQL